MGRGLTVKLIVCESTHPLSVFAQSFTELAPKFEGTNDVEHPIMAVPLGSVHRYELMVLGGFTVT
jgi:hypothetical protein